VCARGGEVALEGNAISNSYFFVPIRLISPFPSRFVEYLQNGQAYWSERQRERERGERFAKRGAP
jgi:hypothetical protein